MDVRIFNNAAHKDKIEDGEWYVKRYNEKQNLF